ncbi:MAG TPA: hypothetical protein VF032_07990 [Thermoleophilaceae bacterium]
MALDGEAGPSQAAPARDSALETLPGESRWPPVVAVLAFMALNIALRVWIPHGGLAHVWWLVPSLEALFVVLLLASHPSGVREHRRLRRLSLILIGLLLAATLGSTALLVRDLINGSGVSNKPSELLASGAIVWLGNNLAFALLYWLIDGGGPIARSTQSRPVDFAFTQQLSPEIAPAGWRPVFLDYLHLGFTNATAFSPTDVMPLTHRAKFAMVVQSTVAIALFGLVVARAVNAFT